MRPGRSYPEDVMDCTVSIFDKDSKARLFSVNTVLANLNGYHVNILPLDGEQVEETISDKLRNALKCDSFDEVNVTVSVADKSGAGTDEAVYFRILDKNGKWIKARQKGRDKYETKVSLDQGKWTNDFERDSCATYTVQTQELVNVRDVDCFSLRRESDGDKNYAKLYIKSFEVWTSSGGHIVRLAK
jgi:hypothetical protein